MSTAAPPPSRPGGRWRVLIALVVGLLVGVIGVGALALSGSRPFSSARRSADTQVIEAVRREQQVVLLSLGVQGLKEVTANSKLFGKNIPFTDRSVFVQYTYRAKLGIEGKDVSVQTTGKHAYRVDVPGFIFIGHDREQFKTAIEKNGALSWITPDIDTAEAIGEILNSDAKKQQILDNLEQLKEQTKVFYGGIISGVDAQASIEYRFAGAGG